MKTFQCSVWFCCMNINNYQWDSAVTARNMYYGFSDPWICYVFHTFHRMLSSISPRPSLNCWRDKKEFVYFFKHCTVHNSASYFSILVLNGIGMLNRYAFYWHLYCSNDICWYHKLKKQQKSIQWALRYANQPHNSSLLGTNSVHA